MSPSTDIAGARGYDWHSILVRTGVFQGGGNDAEHPAIHVAAHVKDAVHWAFDRELSSRPQ